MLERFIEERVRPLARAFVQADLARVRVAGEDGEIEMRRSPRPIAAATSGPLEAESAPRNLSVITADLVGIVRFVRPAVAIGTVLEGDRELAAIEALGIRNGVRAGGPGKIAVVYVEEGQAVDYGAPLFAIER